MSVRVIPPVDPKNPRDRGYTIVVRDDHPRPRWFASTRVDSGTWRGRYGPTAEIAVERLRDWIEASG